MRVLQQEQQLVALEVAHPGQAPSLVSYADGRLQRERQDPLACGSAAPLVCRLEQMQDRLLSSCVLVFWERCLQRWWLRTLYF